MDTPDLRHLDAASVSSQTQGSSDTSDDDNDGEWLDVDPDRDEGVAVVSLFDDTVFPDAQSMLNHCKDKYDFDFVATCRRLALDFHGAVKLINFGKPQTQPSLRLPAPPDFDQPACPHARGRSFPRPCLLWTSRTISF